MLGVQDMGATTMFANLHVHGGTNHLLGMPTGLLFKHDEQAASSSAALVGGTVRVDFTDARHFNDVHPHEITSILAPRLRRWLLAGGHSGRQFGAYVARVMHLKAPPAVHQRLGARAHFVPYLIPMVELRRLVLEATRGGTRAPAPTTAVGMATNHEKRAAAPPPGAGSTAVEPFVVEYAKVDPVAGKELGRFKLRFDKRGRGTCLRGGAECRRDLRRLTTPLPAWASRVLLFFSFPVAKGQTTFRELSCTC